MVWYEVGLVHTAKTGLHYSERYVLHSRGTASEIPEEGRDDVKSAWPYGLGQTRTTMAMKMGSKAVRRGKSEKIASVWIFLCNSGI